MIILYDFKLVFVCISNHCNKKIELFKLVIFNVAVEAKAFTRIISVALHHFLVNFTIINESFKNVSVIFLEILKLKKTSKLNFSNHFLFDFCYQNLIFGNFCPSSNHGGRQHFY